MKCFSYFYGLMGTAVQCVAFLAVAVIIFSCTQSPTESQENQKPVITLKGANPDTIKIGDSYNLLDSGWIATDREDGDLTLAVTADYSGIDASNPGTYYVVYKVKDSKNEETTVRRTVVVRDNVKIISSCTINDMIFDDEDITYKFTCDPLYIKGNVVFKEHTKAIFMGYIRLQSGGKLTVEKGVKFLFDEGAYIYNEGGILLINGEPSDSVLFKNLIPGKYWGSKDNAWGGITLGSNTNGSTAIKFCIIDSATNGITVEKDGLVLKNNTIRNSSSNGIIFHKCGPKDSASFTGNSFVNNGSGANDYPLVINVAWLTRLSSDGVFVGNSQQAIRVICNGSTNKVTESGTWRKQAVPYVFTDSYAYLDNPNGVTIRVGPGATFRLNEGVYLYIEQATFIASGTAEDSIFFGTAENGKFWGSEDSYWGGITLGSNTNGSTAIKFCIIDSATNGITVEKDGLVLKNNTIRNSSSNGIIFHKCGPKDSASFTGNSFVNNGSGANDYPLVINVAWLTRLSSDGVFVGNSQQAIRVICNGSTNKVTESGTWRKQAVPYVFTDSYAYLDNPNGVTIRVGPGATFRLNEGVYLYIEQATFIASGTAEDSIFFGTAENGKFWGSEDSYWGGISIDASANAKCTLSYCIIDSATNGITVEKDGLVLKNNTIRNSSSNGIIFHKCGPKDSASFTGNSFVNNGSGANDYPLVINVAWLTRLSSDGVFVGNSQQAIRVICNGSTNKVTESGTWRKQAVPYVFTDSYAYLDNPNGVTINVEKATTIKFHSGSYIYIVQAVFKATGTPSDSIRFENAVGGQSWGSEGGIYFYSTTVAGSILEYCHITQCGENGIYMDYVKEPIKITKCTISECKGYGIYSYKSNNSGIDLASIAFKNCTSGDYLIKN